MLFKIYYQGDYSDSIIVDGEIIQEIKDSTFNELNKRGWKKEDCWSERLEG